jgi:hypothetical protein
MLGNGTFVAPASSASRNASPTPNCGGRFLGELADVGADGTGAEHRHADVFLQQFVANALRDRHHGGLGRDIDHELRGHRDQRRE